MKWLILLALLILTAQLHCWRETAKKKEGEEP